jgi:serine/threonine protein phosphatase PrpC
MSNASQFEYASQTDIGLKRAHNEDAISIHENLDLFILADGMGGYNAGEVASRMCVDIIAQQIQHKKSSPHLPRMLWKASHASRWAAEVIVQANNEVHALAQVNPECAGMGTTVVMGLVDQDRLVVAHVGDSRAYRLRQGQFVQITHDHSVVQAQIDAGLISEQDARYSPIKNLITRAVGSHEDVEVEVHEHKMEVGDVYMLCSDGLTDMLEPHLVHQMLMNLNDNLQECCDQLVAAANQHGGNDNISVLLMRVTQLAKRSLSLFGK